MCYLHEKINKKDKKEDMTLQNIKLYTQTKFLMLLVKNFNEKLP